MTNKKPTKVIIEITAEDWSEKVYSGEKLIAQQINEMVSEGRSRSMYSMDWFEILHDDYEPLAEVMNDLDSGSFDVSCALRQIERDM